MTTIRTRLLVHSATLAALLVVLGCGGGESPTAPSGTADFQGVWQGSWQRTACSDTLQGAGCSGTPSAGGLRLILTQNGTAVEGTVEFVAVVPVTGSVNSSGVLSLSGQVHVGGEAPGTFRLSNWSTTRNGSAMSGTFTVTFVADDPLFGTETLQVTLQNVTK